MSDTLTVIIICTIVAAGIGLIIYRKKFRKEKEAVDISMCRTLTVTPLGVKIYAAQTARPEVVAQVDRATTNIFSLARGRGYKNALTAADYEIYIVPAAREYDSDGNYNPNFYLRADDYDGSEFDHNPKAGVGEIYAAEYVLKNRFGFVIADWTRDFARLGEVGGAVHNGYDHLILLKNDEQLFLATMNHANGNAPHPLIY